MTGLIWPHPPSRAITKRRMQRQPYGRDHPNLGDSIPVSLDDHQGRGRPPEPEQNHKASAEPDVDPEQNHATSPQGAKPDTATETAEQENTGCPVERQAGTSNDFAANGAPPRTHHRTGQP